MATFLSGIPQYNPDEVTIYHEIGHAIMARLFGRRVHNIVLVLNVAGTYNGSTDWGRDDNMRNWQTSPRMVYISWQ